MRDAEVLTATRIETTWRRWFGARVLGDAEVLTATRIRKEDRECRD